MANEQPMAWDAVFIEEQKQIQRRRSKADADDDLVGLAFSGGGIRSATFGLGVLEYLKSAGWLKKVDYLSTVSGGGYIGSWLSAACLRAAERRAHPENAPTDLEGKAAYNKASADWLDPAADWKPSIAHLRRYSNYLSPSIGFFNADTWAMLTIWLRNTLLVQLTVFFALALALLIPRLLFKGFIAWPQVHDWRWITVLLFITAIVGIAANQRRMSKEHEIHFLSPENWGRGLIGALLFLGAAWGFATAKDFDPFIDGPINPTIAALTGFLLVCGGYCLIPTSIKLFGLFQAENARPRQLNYTQGWTQGLVVLPLMTTGYLMAAVLWAEASGNGDLAHMTRFGALFTNAWHYWPFPLSVAFVSLWLLSFCSIRNGQDLKGMLAAAFGPIPAVIVLHAALCAIMLTLQSWSCANDGAWQAFIWAPAMVLFAFSLAVVILIGMMGRQSSEGVREWWSRLGAWLNIYGAAWLVLALAASFGPRWAAFLLNGETWQNASTVGGWLATTLAGLLAGKSGATGDSRQGKGEKSLKENVLEMVATIGPFIFVGGILLALSSGLNLILLNISDPTQDWLNVDVLYDGYWHAITAVSTSQIVVLGMACLICLMILASRVDINEFSLNTFYRNRLARCYLGAAKFLPGERHPQNFTGFDAMDDPFLAELAGNRDKPPAGPLHIVNCALNLGGSSDLALHTRHSATFMLTPYASGSAYPVKEAPGVRRPMGYLATASYGGTDGQPTLGQAISVSGAAASPNMGYHTSPVVAFLLTVFNVRLGWWFPNPRQGSRHPSPLFSLRYLFKELLGGADDKSRYLMISDGGHFENLAAYELLRRHCRVIVISDAECDPEYKFDGLGTLIRMAEVDMNVRIDIKLDAIRPNAKTQLSALRYAVGRIDYGAGQPAGVLIYLKASLNGREDVSVQQYKASHPDFPHETTADQFYGEDQFESYRRLGLEVAASAFARVAGASDWNSLTDALLQQFHADDLQRQAARPI